MSEDFISYYRVSTKGQEESGLGLEAQRTMATRETSKGMIIREFTEVESGRKSRRPQLMEAIKLAKSTGATLVVAKLDRLSRNVAFTSALLDSGVKFICCDAPYASRLTIHILAAVAEEEARLIRERTKAALAELKKRGVKLGSARPGHWEGREHLRGWRPGSKLSNEIKAERFQTTYGDVIPFVRVLSNRGEGPSVIAGELNKAGYKTSKGKDFTACAVHRIIEKLEILQLAS
jgi:DNA invertase Pin-like site-specific DNA recombinase